MSAPCYSVKNIGVNALEITGRIPESTGPLVTVLEPGEEAFFFSIISTETLIFREIPRAEINAINLPGEAA